MRTTVVLAAVLLCCAACGDDGPQPGDLPYIPELADQVPVAPDATYDECGLGGGPQTVTGTITNSADAPKDFVITFNWVDDELELRGQGVAVVEDLAPGATADWSATGQLLDGATQCVPSFFRGDLDE
ncbi:MAG TPA: FxLYD domain-containing protein [Nocardioidaceae bacterium]|nr:FxLYD domain-containing protein [Nocardioidaceae bacterium]